MSRTCELDEGQMNETTEVINTPQALMELLKLTDTRDPNPKGTEDFCQNTPQTKRITCSIGCRKWSAVRHRDFKSW
jgi:hypothetical protein